ncbi:PREDICTED: cyclin-dependent kinase 12 isoform X2 [Populus euphratica]|uniref:Cyclin-dependent kinase 12 isoform X2 n=1 Tax=Populus euphratica TaxID=75702 RepID=A0AAJ6X7F9_POPEU|nr:PREDICTED: cyclin-dependent kinase 12 isoform X2 [Populus euphratica]
MAYRRRQQQLEEETSGRSRPSPITTTTSSSSYSLDEEDWSYEDVQIPNDSNIKNKSNSTSLATKAIRASSAAHRDSSLSSAYAFTNHRSPSPSSDSTNFNSSSTKEEESNKAYYHEYTSMKAMKETKQQQGFWGTLARKAKSILDDDFNTDSNNAPSPQKPHRHQQLDSATDRTTTRQHQVPDSATMPKYQNQYPSHETYRKTESPAFQKGLNAISSSLNYIGNAVEEGLTKVENRTADIIQETRKHIQKKPNGAAGQNQATNRSSIWQQPQMQTNRQQPQKETEQELQLKASRDVAMAMAAKAKLLLRELKTVKADLAFAKERCAQLEEENKILRENHERGENLEDDDLIRLQLETLLAEKARLAHENSVYARENRFLREVVEYHQLTMQDVVYLDEGTEEVTEVYPVKVVSNTPSIPSTSPPPLYTEASHGTSLPVTQDILPHPVPPPGSVEVSKSATSPNSYARHQLQQI